MSLELNGTPLHRVAPHPSKTSPPDFRGFAAALKTKRGTGQKLPAQTKAQPFSQQAPASSSTDSTPDQAFNDSPSSETPCVAAALEPEEDPPTVKIRRGVPAKPDPVTARIISDRDAALQRRFVVAPDREIDVQGGVAQDVVPSRASIVEKSILAKYGAWLPDDAQPARHVLVLSPDDFANYWNRSGGKGNPPLGFQVTRGKNVSLIAVRVGNESAPVLTHEILHHYASHEFERVARRFYVANAITNLPVEELDTATLWEGATEFLNLQLNPTSQRQNPREQEFYPKQVAIVRQIYEKIGEDTFNRAFFGGDPDAVNAFWKAAYNARGVIWGGTGGGREAFGSRSASAAPSAAFPSSAASPSPADLLEASISQKTDDITNALLREHESAPTSDASPLAFLIEGLKRAITNAAHQPDIEAAVLSKAKDNTSRLGAFNAMTELVQKRGTAGKIIEGIDADAVAGEVIADEYSKEPPEVQAGIRAAIKEKLESLGKSEVQRIIELVWVRATQSLAESAPVAAAADGVTPDVDTALKTVWPDFVNTPEFDVALRTLVGRQVEKTVRGQAYGSGGSAPTAPGDINAAIDRVNDAAFDGRAETLTGLQGDPNNVDQAHVDALVEDAAGMSVQAAGAFAAEDAAVAAGADDTIVKAAQDAASAAAVKHLTDAVVSLLKNQAKTVAEPIVKRAGLPEQERIAFDAAAGQAIGTKGVSKSDRKAAVRIARTNLTSDAHDILDRALTEYAGDARRGTGVKSLPEYIDRAKAAVEREITAARPLTLAQQQKVNALPAAAQIAMRAIRAEMGGAVEKKSGTGPTGTPAFETWKALAGKGSTPLGRERNAKAVLLNSADKRIDAFARSATGTAADRAVRHVDFRKIGQKAGEQSIVVRIKTAPAFVSAGPAKQAAVASGIAGSRDASRSAASAAKAAAASAFAERLYEEVRGLTSQPNPNAVSHGWLERVVGPTTRPFEGWASLSYTEDVFKGYQDAYGAFMPEILRTPTTAAGGLKPDQFTMRLVEVPGGTEVFTADGHGHPTNYAQTGSLKNLVASFGKSGRGTIMGIPQNCGGPAHYSTSIPGALTMAAARALDERLYREWEDQSPDGNITITREQAQADITITGFDFADETSDPGEYLRAFTLRHPHVAAVGEVTSRKELVRPGLGESAWDVDDPGFRSFLLAASNTGHHSTVHCDGGDPALSLAGRAAPGKQLYENVSRIIAVARQYPKAHITLAHASGIGRLVRPDNKWVDPATGKPVGKSDPDGMPAHVYHMTELLETAPNVILDIAWNDVTQALDELRHSNPRAAAAIVKFFIKYADRIYFGTDTVKPVNEGTFNQALMLASPLMMDILRADIADFKNRNPGTMTVEGDGSMVVTKADGSKVIFGENDSAAWKILRGTYDKTFDGAYDRVAKWQDTQRVPSDKLKAERRQLRALRKELHDESWSDFQRWAGLVAKSPDDWSPEAQSAPKGVYAALSEEHPYSIHLGPGEATQRGRGTAGGDLNDNQRRRVATAVATGAGVAVAGGGMAALDLNGGHAVTTTAGGGLVPTAPGSGVADGLNSGFFDARAGMNIVRTFVGEKLRLEWEKIFEQGEVTREGLNRYVSRLFNASSALHITELQRVQIAAVTEQFWANYQYLRDVPLDESRGWTPAHKFNVIMGEVGRYQITVNRILTMQDTSISPFDARRPLGKLFNGSAVVSYAGNVTFTAEWAAHLGSAFHAMAMSPHPGWSAAGHIGAFAVDAGFHAVFGAANAMQLVRTTGSFFGGMAGITGTETNRWQRGLQRWSLRGFTLGGGLWAADGIQGAVSSAAHGDWGNFGLQLARSALDAGFTYGSWSSYRLAAKGDKARPMPTPGKQATPSVAQNLPLALNETSQLGQQAEPGTVKIAAEGLKHVFDFFRHG